MEAAIRWSQETSSYLLVDVAGNNIAVHECGSTKPIRSNVVARYDRVPNFTAFDWSRSDRSLIALGLSSGDASLVKVKPETKTIEPQVIFPIKTQRKCNSITFNPENLLAVGLDRVRNDHCLNVYDVHGSKEPHSRLCTGEAVSSVRFFPQHPQELVAAVARSTLRLYDLRDSSLASSSSVYTRQVNNIAIDPLDDNFFASGGSTGEPTISIWDKRWLGGTDTSSAVLELRPAVDVSQTTTVWSIRYSNWKRGRFCVLSSVGEVKIYDMSSHGMPRSKIIPTNPYGGSPWSQSHYIRFSRHLQHPFHHHTHGQESNRVIAFDWLGEGEDRSILTLRPTREVGSLELRACAKASLTPRDDLILVRDDIAIIEPRKATTSSISHDVQDVHVVSDQIRPADNIFEPVPSTVLSVPPTSGVEKTERWLQRSMDPAPMTVTAKDFQGSLTILNVPKRRCLEGYRFDCKKNGEIIREDQRLVKLWAIIDRLQGLAKNDGMKSDGLDLSYQGVSSIWSGDEDYSDILAAHGLPELDDLPASTWRQRMICLELCGWCFSREGIEAKCLDLLEQGQHHRAITVACLQGHPDVSITMLRNLTRQKTIEASGVGALIAAGQLNDDQVEMCRWMEEDASDPYLGALLRYLGTRDWKSIISNPSINLSDRLGVALRYLGDSDVAVLINETTNSSVSSGDVSGVLLTGLREAAMPLFQNYISITNDLQTAVLATSFANPLYVDDIRYSMWKETYFWQLQSWKAFIERSRFISEHTRLSMNGPQSLVRQPPRQITVRCSHCNGSLSDMTNAAVKAGSTAQRPSSTSGTVCGKCKSHLPRCSICMQWLGIPTSIQVKKGDTARLITFCNNCGHGFHAHHARQWFGKHATCPVPDCQCLCGVRG